MAALPYLTGILGVTVGFSTQITLHSHLSSIFFDIKFCWTFWTSMSPKSSKGREQLCLSFRSGSKPLASPSLLCSTFYYLFCMGNSAVIISNIFFVLSLNEPPLYLVVYFNVLNIKNLVYLFLVSMSLGAPRFYK